MLFGCGRFTPEIGEPVELPQSTRDFIKKWAAEQAKKPISDNKALELARILDGGR